MGVTGESVDSCSKYTVRSERGARLVPHILEFKIISIAVSKAGYIHASRSFRSNKLIHNMTTFTSRTFDILFWDVLQQP